MNLIPFPWGKTKKSDEGKPFDVEKYLKNLSVSTEGFVEEEGITYIKSVNLADDNAIETTTKELAKENIVLLNIREMLSNPIALSDKVRRIKEYCNLNGGDVVRISEIKILVVPQTVKVAYNTPPQEQ
jgi:SepF-like predicted cell division protein (DUF552 family)